MKVLRNDTHGEEAIKSHRLSYNNQIETTNKDSGYQKLRRAAVKVIMVNKIANTKLPLLMQNPSQKRNEEHFVGYTLYMTKDIV